MDEKGFRQLEIDNDFKNLIRPLMKTEYSQLELNLVVEGCREPILVWNDKIIDGHNRYEICNRLHIPYASKDIEFDSREEVVVWICNNQLGRRNITEESRKYLIGRRYDAEKCLGTKKNAAGNNQYRKQNGLRVRESVESGETDTTESNRRTAWRLGQEYHLSTGAVQKYSKYSQAIDAISKVAPDLQQKILSGTYKISHENLQSLSKMGEDEILGLAHKLETGQSYIKYSESRKSITGEQQRKPPGPAPANPEIKKMPTFDPDAEVTGLALTVPSWISSIERVRQASDFNTVSTTARSGLRKALLDLMTKIDEVLSDIKEDPNAGL